MKNKISIGLFVLFVSICCSAVSPLSVFAYTWCHDFTLYQLTRGKEDPDEMKVQELREKLLKMKLVRHKYPAGSDWDIVQEWLFPYDVIIIGNAHSGIVTLRQDGDVYNGQGNIGSRNMRKILHYTQKPDGTIKAHTLPDLMNNYPGAAGTYPYRNMAIELWRWVAPGKTEGRPYSEEPIRPEFMPREHQPQNENPVFL